VTSLRERIGGMWASVSAARRGWWLMAVFVLAVAVVGMHSLGAGHHGATAPSDHGEHQVVSVGAHAYQQANMAPSEQGFADPTGQSRPGHVAPSQAAAACIGCESEGGLALGAMCLAVVASLLAMALLASLRRLHGGRLALMLLEWAHVMVKPRPPDRRMALSPIEVCVLRT
jgi:hypothetical protein